MEDLKRDAAPDLAESEQGAASKPGEIKRAELLRRAAGVALVGSGYAGMSSLFPPSALAGAATRSRSARAGLTADLRIGVGTLNDQVLDPASAVSSSLPWLELVFDYLIGIDATGRPSKANGLVNNWTIKRNPGGAGAVYTLTLRRGIQFANGDELTSADVKFSLDAVTSISPPHRSSSAPFLRQLIKSVEAPARYTVVINAATDAAVLLVLLSRSGDSAGLIRPARYIASNAASFRAKPIGTGSYVVSENVSGTQITFQSTGRPHWLHGKQRFKTVSLLPRPEEGVAIAGLLTGELHLINVSTAGSKRISRPNLALARSRGSQPVLVLPVTTWKGGLNDIRVRRALDMAIDRNAIARAVFAGGAVPSRSYPITPNNLDISRYQRLPASKYDRAAAASLLKSASPEGVSLTIALTQQAGIPELPSVMEALSDMWSAIGVRTSNVKTDVPTILSQMTANKAQDLMWGYGGSNRPFQFSTFTNYQTGSIRSVAQDRKMDAAIYRTTNAHDVSSYTDRWFEAGKYIDQMIYNYPIVEADIVFAGVKEVLRQWVPNKGGVAYLPPDLLSLVVEK